MEEPHLSPAGCRRRASLRVQKRQGRVVLGFNEGESHRLVDIAECPVLDPVLFALVEPLRKLSRSEEHTSELQSLMRISYAVFCLKKKIPQTNIKHIIHYTKQSTKR